MRNESFVVRQHVAPGPHVDQPGDHATTPANGGIRAVDGSAEESPLLAMSSSHQILRTKLREKREEEKETRKEEKEAERTRSLAFILSILA